MIHYLEEYIRKNGKPDGFVIAHHRATDILHFGPFATIQEVDQWLKAHPEVRGVVIPTHKDVNWNRGG